MASQSSLRHRWYCVNSGALWVTSLVTTIQHIYLSILANTNLSWPARGLVNLTVVLVSGFIWISFCCSLTHMACEFVTAGAARQKRSPIILSAGVINHKGLTQACLKHRLGLQPCSFHKLFLQWLKNIKHTQTPTQTKTKESGLVIAWDFAIAVSGWWFDRHMTMTSMQCNWETRKQLRNVCFTKEF